mmetsp:Transcript_2339/g.9144  ORF Transcript_2339/g.9144 Transcript_2339/m.9144 type:complete len:203 (+) Transcript_2339:1216-1824(+)
MSLSTYLAMSSAVGCWSDSPSALQLTSLRITLETTWRMAGSSAHCSATMELKKVMSAMSASMKSESSVKMSARRSLASTARCTSEARFLRMPSPASVMYSEMSSAIFWAPAPSPNWLSTRYMHAMSSSRCSRIISASPVECRTTSSSLESRTASRKLSRAASHVLGLSVARARDCSVASALSAAAQNSDMLPEANHSSLRAE